jgi:phosphoribosylglycinamide formyltransferase-1
VIKIAIFASGSGSNAEEIIKYFQNKADITVQLILSNNPKAYVLERAKKLNIPSDTFTRKNFYDSDKVLNILKEHDIDFIVLAGFLWLIPVNLIENYPDKIINIHPALLPSYGGKGMYGAKIHKAVVEAGEKETGITIHHVNSAYDKGTVIFQAKCPVQEGDTAEIIQQRVQHLEYQHFPVIIEKTIRETFKI